MYAYKNQNGVAIRVRFVDILSVLIYPTNQYVCSKTDK